MDLHKKQKTYKKIKKNSTQNMVFHIEEICKSVKQVHLNFRVVTVSETSLK